MAEYYAVLRRAVASLEASSPDARRAVYDKARNALIGQLKAINPPLPTSEISRQRLELEEAIRRVERETSAVPAGAPAKTAPAAAPPSPTAAPVRRAPQDVFRRAIQDAERDRVEEQEEPVLDRAPVAAARADTTFEGERIERVPPPARQQQSYLPSQGYVEEEHHDDEPRLAPDYDHDWDRVEPVAAAAPDVNGDSRPAKGRRGRRSGRARDHDTMERSARPSRLPGVLLMVLIVAMLGGLGALGWSQRDVLADLAAGVLSASDSGTQPPAAATAAGEDAGGKDTESLLSGGEGTPASNVRVVAPEAGAADDPIGQQLANDAAGPGATMAAAETEPAETDALVAQRAVLYEEPLEAAAAAAGVVAINAAVTWSYLPNGINGPEIVGNVDVPERALKIKLAIRRNTDETLPASHIVEVVVDAPSDFPGQGVRDVPRVVFKPSEDARGQPLIGASARVADGFFWIALSGVESDVTANLNLLRDRIWIDLPLVYDSGQRAILTIEKGTPGERVFERALTAWAG